MSEKDEPLSSLVAQRIAKFPVSGEINRGLEDPQEALERVRERFEADAISVDETDGVSLEFADWRMNLRLSNTEPVLRLNVEARGDRTLMERQTKEVLALMES